MPTITVQWRIQLGKSIFFPEKFWFESCCSIPIIKFFAKKKHEYTANFQKFHKIHTYYAKQNKNFFSKTVLKSNAMIFLRQKNLSGKKVNQTLI